MLFLFVEFVDAEKINNFYCRAAIGFASLLFIFSLPVFLNSLFSPNPKKYGAIAGLSIAGLFLFFLIFYYLFIGEDKGQNASPELMAGMAACFNGAAVGFVASYLVFKNKGWEIAGKEVEIPETY